MKERRNLQAADLRVVFDRFTVRGFDDQLHQQVRLQRESAPGTFAPDAGATTTKIIS